MAHTRAGETQDPITRFVSLTVEELLSERLHTSLEDSALGAINVLLELDLPVPSLLPIAYTGAVFPESALCLSR
jgi:hypothetical protein